MDKENALINIITTSNVRFQGILLKVDGNTKTISLKDVKNFGTEDRDAENKIEPVDEMTKIIEFSSKQIKDLEVLNNDKNDNTKTKQDNKTENKVKVNENEKNKDKNIENNKEKTKDEIYDFDGFFDNISSSINKNNYNRKGNREQLKDAKETFGNYDVVNHLNRQKYKPNFNNLRNNRNKFNKNKNNNNNKNYYYAKRNTNHNDNFYYIKKEDANK